MSGGQNLQQPRVFRFHPTDEELNMHYLRRRCAGLRIAVPIIAEIDLKFDPGQLPRVVLLPAGPQVSERVQAQPRRRIGVLEGHGRRQARGLAEAAGHQEGARLLRGEGAQGREDQSDHARVPPRRHRPLRPQEQPLGTRAPGSASIVRAIKTIPADKQIAALKKKNKILEDYGRAKKKECEEWKEKYKGEKKSGERLQNNLGRSCRRH